MLLDDKIWLCRMLSREDSNYDVQTHWMEYAVILSDKTESRYMSTRKRVFRLVQDLLDE